MRSRELVMEAHGFVFHNSILPNWPHPLHIYLLPLLICRCNIATTTTLSVALSLSLNMGEREKGLSKGNLFKRMNKASTCYATSQEKNFADGFFAGFQLGAEKMGFSC
ncbi:hypothetical protein NC652_012395 [Populus alba x Populus x berolinensis]|nr:hypothetical protein NC652_012395 [Populus alba x Populus x berolinensis]